MDDAIVLEKFLTICIASNVAQREFYVFVLGVCMSVVSLFIA